MPVPQPSRFARNVLKIASLGIAGLIAGLLTGCSSTDGALLVRPHVDTDWQASPTYASSIVNAPINRHAPSGHIHEAHATAAASPHRAHL